VAQSQAKVAHPNAAPTIDADETEITYLAKRHRVSPAGRVQASEQRLNVRLRRARRDGEVATITRSVNAIGCAAMPGNRLVLRCHE
jgi:hypothetical protein